MEVGGMEMEKAGWLTGRVRQEEKRLVGRSDAGNRTAAQVAQVCITPFADHKPRSGHARVRVDGQVMYRRGGKRKQAGERSRGGRKELAMSFRLCALLLLLNNNNNKNNDHKRREGAHRRDNQEGRGWEGEGENFCS
jgi:hypothetical protein